AGSLVVDSGGSCSNSLFTSVGQSAGDNGTLTVRGTGSVTVSADFNVGDNGTTANPATGTLNISDNASLTANKLFLGSAFSGSVAAATCTVTQGGGQGGGGTVTTTGGGDGNFIIGGRNAGSTNG